MGIALLATLILIWTLAPTSFNDGTHEFLQSADAGAEIDPYRVAELSAAARVDAEVAAELTKEAARRGPRSRLIAAIVVAQSHPGLAGDPEREVLSTIGLQAPELWLRKLCARVLAKMGDPSSIPAIVQALEDARDEADSADLTDLRRGLVQALGAFDSSHSQLERAVLASLDDRAAPVRLEAIHALRRLRIVSAVATRKLQEMARSDPALYVQDAAHVVLECRR